VSSFTVDEAEDILGFYFLDTDLTPPPDMYIALHNGSPGSNGDFNEVDASGYQRIQMQAPDDWSRDGSRKITNSTEIIFGPAGEDWGDISHYSAWDSQTGGHSYFVESTNSTVTVTIDRRVRFDVDELVFEVPS